MPHSLSPPRSPISPLSEHSTRTIANWRGINMLIYCHNNLEQSHRPATPYDRPTDRMDRTTDGIAWKWLLLLPPIHQYMIIWTCGTIPRQAERERERHFNRWTQQHRVCISHSLSIGFSLLVWSQLHITICVCGSGRPGFIEPCIIKSSAALYQSYCIKRALYLWTKTAGESN